MKLKNYFQPFLFIVILSLVITAYPVSAAQSGSSFVDILRENLTKTFTASGIQPTQAQTNIKAIAVNLINAALTIFGIVFVGLLIYGGWLYMTAAGNQDRIDQGLKVIKWAIIGIIIVMASLSISVFVTKSIIESTDGIFISP